MRRSIDVGLPEPARLEATLRGLANARRDIDVVRFVEHWASRSPPTPNAYFIQVEALLSLHLTDAALDRLRHLTATQAHRPELHLLTARCWIARGTPFNAQKPITRLAEIHPNAPQLDTLVRQANQLPPAAPTLANGATETETVTRAVSVALAAGVQLRAAQWLARIPEAPGEDDRLARLRWALRGDLSMTAEEFCALLEEMPETTEETESTDTATRRVVRARDGARFPSLFLGVPRPTPQPADGNAESGPVTIGPAAPARLDGDPHHKKSSDEATPIHPVIHQAARWERPESLHLATTDRVSPRKTPGRPALDVALTLQRPSSDLDDGDDLAEDDERIIRNAPRASKRPPPLALDPTAQAPSSPGNVSDRPIVVFNPPPGSAQRRIRWSPWTVALATTLIIASLLVTLAATALALR